MAYDLPDIKNRMQKSITSLRDELAGLRTGRASASLLEPVTVEAYGSRMPLNQVATVTVPEPRMLSVQVWDRSLAMAVEKAIRDSGLGLNPMGEGQVIRVPLPPLTQERRADLIKTAGKYAEATKVSIRGVRRDGMEQIKAQEKDKKAPIGQDESKDWADEVQKLTDQYIKLVDTTLADKEKDIRQV